MPSRNTLGFGFISIRLTSLHGGTWEPFLLMNYARSSPIRTVVSSEMNEICFCYLRVSCAFAEATSRETPTVRFLWNMYG